MSSNLPRYRQRRVRDVPLLVRVGLLALVGFLAIGAVVVAITDGPPMLHARAEGGSQVDDFTIGETPSPHTGTTPSGSPSEPGETPSPTGSESPSPDESDDTDNGSDDDSGGSDENSEDSDDHYSATTPPREPDSPRPSDPSEPTDEPSEPSEDPSDEPSEEPSDEPSDEPSVEPPSEEPSDDPDLELPIVELSSAEERMLDSAEEARSEAGCPALRVDPRLTIAARQHSEDMRERDYYSHVNPDGEGPADRAADEGYTGRVGENLARGSLRSAEQVVREWENGGDDRDRLLDCSYTSVGIGTETGGLLGWSSWWTLMLGTD